VTQEIVTALAVNLTSEERQDRARTETLSPEAYDAFLKGWQHYQRQRREDFTQAVALFKEAIAQDETYGRAYAALAATYWQAWKRVWHDAVGLLRWHDARYEAEQFLAQALNDPTPLAYQIAAQVAMTMGRHEEAITQAKRAIAIDPNDAEAYVALAGVQSLSGQPEEALTAIEHAMRLNPRYPPSYLYQLALAQFGLEHYEDALGTLERAAALNPQDRYTFRLMLATYGQLGKEEKAADILADIDNWYYPDSLSIRTILFWLPFKNSTDADRIAEGLRSVGVPE
jgi:tetratricopeptide (TPR) repeat protein